MYAHGTQQSYGLESRRGTVVAVRRPNGTLDCRFVPDDDPRKELSVSRLPKDNASNYDQPVIDLRPYLGLSITITGAFNDDKIVYNVSTIRIAYGSKRNITVRS